MHRPNVRQTLIRGVQNGCRAGNTLGTRCQDLSTSRHQEVDRPSGRDRSTTAVSRLSQLNSQPHPNQSPSTRPVQARPLAASTVGRNSTDASQVSPVRSLRGSLHDGSPGGGPRGARTLLRLEGGVFRRGVLGGGVGHGRGGRRGARRGGRQGGRAGRGGLSKARVSDREVDLGKLEWDPEEQAVIDEMDHGVPMLYTPSLKRSELIGFGPAVASDSPLGPIEMAMRSMRIMGGGAPFNPDGATSDKGIALKRYMSELKPLFFNTEQERKWLLSNKLPRQLKIFPPQPNVKNAILSLTVAGHYRAPRYADVSDSVGVVGSYHKTTFTYRRSDCNKFNDKLKELLAAGGASTKSLTKSRLA